MPTSETTLQLQDFVSRGRNPDGGWPYHEGKATRLEPTCWAMLASQGNAHPGALQKWPVSNGLLGDLAGGSPNYAFNGLALVTMRALGIEHAAGNLNVLASLQKVRGVKLTPSTINRQDNSIQAWSWVPETFSWVE